MTKGTGKGTEHLAKTAKYTGDFVDDKWTGKGTYTWPDGRKYTGDFVNGKRTGKGTYTGSDGNTYTGDDEETRKIIDHIEEFMGPSPDLCCSFCGKNKDEVEQLIAGPCVYICNECVSLCADVIKN